MEHDHGETSRWEERVKEMMGDDGERKITVWKEVG